jgi:hypothetical protein
LQDIVVPFMALTSHDRFLVHTPLNPLNAPARQRSTTLFFAGGLCGSGKRFDLPPNCSDPVKTVRYSGGVRQQVGGGGGQGRARGCWGSRGMGWRRSQFFTSFVRKGD